MADDKSPPVTPPVTPPVPPPVPPPEKPSKPPVTPPVTPPVPPPEKPPEKPSKPAGKKKYFVSLDGYPAFPLGVEATATFTTDDPGKLKDMFLEKFGLTELPQPLLFKEV